MQQTNLIDPGHADLVTHIVYDFYGERLATCSADQRIKIFRRSTEGTWEPEADWKAHDAPILQLSFAHPLHGSLLASCGHDRTVRIWEEPAITPGQANAVNGPGGIGGSNGAGVISGKEGTRWTERATLGGAKGSVRQVEFSPPNPSFGLRVGAIATDSHLRIYTSLDPSLNDWSTVHDVHIPSLPPPSSSDESRSAAHGANASGPSSGAGTGSGSVYGDDSTGGGTLEMSTGGWGLSWCKEKWWGSVLASFSGLNPTVKIIVLDPTPTALLQLTPPSSSSSVPLTSLSWAPSCGRSYHLIATGSRDGTVRIWRIEPPDTTEMGDGRHSAWKGEIVGEFGQGGARVGMVDWNATGTTLTTSDDDGIIRIYKPTYAKAWKLLGKMTAEEPPTDEMNGH